MSKYNLKYNLSFVEQLLKIVDCVDLSKRIKKDFEILEDRLFTELGSFIDEQTSILLDEYEPCEKRTECLRLLFKAWVLREHFGQKPSLLDWEDERESFEMLHGVIEELHND